MSTSSKHSDIEKEVTRLRAVYQGKRRHEKNRTFLSNIDALNAQLTAVTKTAESRQEKVRDLPNLEPSAEGDDERNKRRRVTGSHTTPTVPSHVPHGVWFIPDEQAGNAGASKNGEEMSPPDLTTYSFPDKSTGHERLWMGSASGRPFVSVVSSGAAQAQAGSYQQGQVPVLLPKALKYPPSTAYAPLRRNFRVEDQPLLSHVPFFEDTEKINDLATVYSGVQADEEGTALEKMGDSDLIDFILPTITDRFGDGKEEMESLAQALSCSVTDIETRKKKLQEAKSKPAGSVAAPAPNLKPQNEAQYLDSYRTLFCRRCFVYDCRLHGLPPSAMAAGVHKPTSSQFTRLKGVLSSRDGPCGRSCHQKKAGGEGSAGRKSERPFTDFELQAYAKAVQIVGDPTQICAIARLIPSRTCAQVHRHAKLNESNPPLIPSPERPAQSRPGSKKTKTQKRQHQAIWNKMVKTRLESTRENDGIVSHYEPCVCQYDAETGMTCDSKSCTCYPQGCEKFCRCEGKCALRASEGCNCKAGRCRTRACPCWAAGRECDPDICRSCGSAAVVNASLRFSSKAGIALPSPDFAKLCDNVNIQSGRHKHLFLIHSEVAGWGVALREPVQKDEFIQEYVGELITQNEAERRGTIYDLRLSSYLFNLNSEFTVDANRKGNKTKFINHSDRPNCRARIVKVNGNHRIGLFAKHDIPAGEELFFNYQYKSENQKYVTGERKSRPARRSQGVSKKKA